MKKFINGWLFFFTSIILLLTFVVIKPSPSLKTRENEQQQDFHVFFQNKLDKSLQESVRANNEERLVRQSDSLTETAILYIHGFGASRAEGEYVTDSLGSYMAASTYYLRLPGHGTNKKDHASRSFEEYIYEAEEALLMMKHLGKKTIVVGTSMGGLLATYLAAQYPENVDALILCSPFYDYANPAGNLVNIPGMVDFMDYIQEKGRITLPSDEIKEGKVRPEYSDFWYPAQRYKALSALEELKDYVATEDIFKKVSAPVLLFYYHKNDEEKDNTAAVPAMLEAYDHFEGTKKSKNKIVNVLDGDHVMFSKYILADHSLIFTEAKSFLDQVFHHDNSLSEK